MQVKQTGASSSSLSLALGCSRLSVDEVSMLFITDTPSRHRTEACVQVKPRELVFPAVTLYCTLTQGGAVLYRA